MREDIEFFQALGELEVAKLLYRGKIWGDLPEMRFNNGRGQMVEVVRDTESGAIKVLLDGDFRTLEFDEHRRAVPAYELHPFRITEAGLGVLPVSHSEVEGEAECAAIKHHRETTALPVRPTPTQELILRTLGTQTLKGEKIARNAARKYDGHFKGALSEMVKLELLRKTGHGYKATPKGHTAHPAD